MADPFSTSVLEEALDIEGAREILESFLEDSAGLVEAITEAVVNRKRELLRRDSHKLRGCCRAISAEEGQKIGSDLETCAVESNWQQAEELLPRLKTTYFAIAELARHYLNDA